MPTSLTTNDIDSNHRDKVYKQSYARKKIIDGVKMIPIHTIPSEEGDFSEIVRLDNGQLKQIPGFTVAQINRTRLLPGSVKAWHLHYQQDYVWYISPFAHLIVGLWDLREQSRTKGVTMRLIMGSGTSQLLFIPHGIAQGSMVVNHEPIDLYIFSNIQFSLKNLDERRLPWDSLGSDFWSPQRD